MFWTNQYHTAVHDLQEWEAGVWPDQVRTNQVKKEDCEFGRDDVDSNLDREGVGPAEDEPGDVGQTNQQVAEQD